MGDVGHAAVAERTSARVELKRGACNPYFRRYHLCRSHGLGASLEFHHAYVTGLSVFNDALIAGDEHESLGASGRDQETIG